MHGGAAARGRPGRPWCAGAADSVTHYVNDRPYAASSLLAVALKARVRHRADRALRRRGPSSPARAHPAGDPGARAALRGRGRAGAAALRPARLGRSTREPVPLEPAAWGDSAYVDLRLTGTRAARRRAQPPVRAAARARRRQALLGIHRRGGQAGPGRAAAGWPAHPEKELITGRYLAHQRALTQAALARLAESDDLDPAELDNAVPEPTPEAEPQARPRRGGGGRPARSRCCGAQAVLGGAARGRGAHASPTSAAARGR